MRRLVALAVIVGSAGALALVPATASAASAAGAGARWGGGGLPRQVFAPYFETYDTADGSLATLSQQSGARYLSLAFLQTAQAGSCTAYWNGDASEPIAQSTFGADIDAIQAAGGNVIPSFGGYTADTTGTELADSCTSVPAIAAVFESLITTYHVPRIDLDVEGDSINNAAGINRRNEAIALTEQWAAEHHDRIQFSYTLPTFPTGLTAAGVAVLQNAIADGARISVVNLLTFDYFLGTQQDMVADTESAAAGLLGQLSALYPGVSQRRLWHLIGVTEMPGIDDFGTDETFSQADASTILSWARSEGLAMVSMWALQRDNGNCPGTKGAGNCSGLTQPTWYFSHTFEPFTRGGFFR
jgi:chitinase